MKRRTFLASAAAAVAGCASADRRPLPPISGLDGRVLLRDAPGYEKWRQSMTWQRRKPGRYPDLIVRPENAAQVQAAVRHAARHDLRVAARSGGHHIWSAFLRDGGMLLDLSRMKGWSTGRGVAEVGPSLWARDLIAALAPAGAAFPVAHCATVPLGGYLLGGGMGLNGDAWGAMACQAILGAEVVTAEGDLIVVDERHYPELLWALRGGSSAFPGIVTRFRIKTFDRPAGVVSNTYVFPLARLDAALALLEAVTQARPANTELLALLLHNPQAGPDAPPGLRKLVAVRTQTFEQRPEDAQPLSRLMREFPASGASVFSLPAAEESFEKLFVDSMDWRRGFGFGRFAVDNAWTGDARAALTEVATIYADAPSWKSHVVIQPKLSQVGPQADAFSVMDQTYIGVYGVWDEVGDDPANLAWLASMTSALDRHASGHYVNEINALADQKRLRRCYSPAAWSRLRQLRSQWDSRGVLHDFPGLS